MKEYMATSRSGLMMLAVLPAVFTLAGLGLVVLAGPLKLVAILALILFGIGFFGFYMVQPNQCVVLQLFGRYTGSDLKTGLRWANPFYSKQKVSLRVRNFESGKLKVNDHSGNPVEIAAVVVWKVVDSAEAVFEVEDYENFVSIQSEAALRFLASSYPYEAAEDGDISLRSNGPEVTDLLKGEIQARLEKAGVEVLEARISHLAYAPEIASAMLQRQQARAVVELALARLSEKNMVQLDEERKAAMVSNLLVVLCGDHQVQPVINTGTLY